MDSRGGGATSATGGAAAAEGRLPTRRPRTPPTPCPPPPPPTPPPLVRPPLLLPDAAVGPADDDDDCGAGTRTGACPSREWSLMKSNTEQGAWVSRRSKGVKEGAAVVVGMQRTKERHGDGGTYTLTTSRVSPSTQTGSTSGGRRNERGAQIRKLRNPRHMSAQACANHCTSPHISTQTYAHTHTSTHIHSARH